MIYTVAVVPHGDEIIDPRNENMKKLNAKMNELGKMLKDTDEYVLISPHNIRIDTHIGVILTENLSGKWDYNGIKINKKLRCDRKLAMDIYEKSLQEKIPTVGINFGALEGTLSSMPLDWGSLIPLHFLPERNTVLITPARKISRLNLVKFGNVLVNVLEKRKEKIAVIISADQAHTHSKYGPYGLSINAKDYDSRVFNALKNKNLEELLQMSDDYLDKVKPDSYWQLLILYGIMQKIDFTKEIAEYGVAGYFGMCVVAYSRKPAP